MFCLLLPSLHVGTKTTSCSYSMSYSRCPIADPAQTSVLCQPQLPPHGSQSDRGGVQPNAHRRAHPHWTVPLHRVRPRAHGEDHC